MFLLESNSCVNVLLKFQKGLIFLHNLGVAILAPGSPAACSRIADIQIPSTVHSAEVVVAPPAWFLRGRNDLNEGVERYPSKRGFTLLIWKLFPLAMV